VERHAVVVIGGGVIGVRSALYLAERGCPVTLLEKADICAGASYGNAGLDR
jgi:D-amino-acid dehydrogenase